MGAPLSAPQFPSLLVTMLDSGGRDYITNNCKTSFLSVCQIVQLTYLILLVANCPGPLVAAAANISLFEATPSPILSENLYNDDISFQIISLEFVNGVKPQKLVVVYITSM